MAARVDRGPPLPLRALALPVRGAAWLLVGLARLLIAAGRRLGALADLIDGGRTCP